MTGGDGPNSYAKNSTLQRGGLDVSKELVRKAIAEKLDREILHSNTFRIADLGCSVGPNTFLAVENILEGVEFKYKSQGMNSQFPEFHVFFNDHTSNDFNMLFKTLPQNRRYYAAGVPGSFYGRLFPDASIHLAHSSYAIQWLSRVPKAVVDSKSPFQAGMGEDLKHQFGEEVLDELFDVYRKKCEEHASAVDPGKTVNLVVVLRRKAD